MKTTTIFVLITIFGFIFGSISIFPTSSTIPERKQATLPKNLGINLIDSTNARSIAASSWYLKNRMDEYTNSFDVYTDADAAGNHFTVLGKIGSGASINTSWPIDPHSGLTCIACSYSGLGPFNYGGFYFLNGATQSGSSLPEPGWGQYPGDGYDLSNGTTALTFWGRGQLGGEIIQFFVGGVGRQYPDSGYQSISVNLTKVWAPYSIPLPPSVSLKYISGGFGWSTSAPKPVTFYLDDIKFDTNRTNADRLIDSYTLIPGNTTAGINTAYTYDNALATLAFLSNPTPDNIRRAKIIGDTFVYAQNHDRTFTDGRLRDGYQGGDIALPPGWTVNGKNFTARIPGHIVSNGSWVEDNSSVGTSTGNMAWAIIALLTLYQRTSNSSYLNASIGIGRWINQTCWDMRGNGGFTAGKQGEDLKQVKSETKSTVSNLDAFAAFYRLYEMTGNLTWNASAQHAKTFVENMWDPGQGHFWLGTLADGNAIDKNKMIPVDAQMRAILDLNETSLYRGGVDWAYLHCSATADGYTGYDFDADSDGVWLEGTAQAAVAFKTLGDDANASYLLAQLQYAQVNATNNDGHGLVAASHNNLSTDLGYAYDNRLCVAATAWNIFAQMAINPCWYFSGNASYELDSPLVLPSSPLKLKETSLCGQVMLAWEAPVDDGGMPITSYKVYRGSSAGSETFLTIIGNMTTYLDTGLSNDQAYFYQVRGVNNAGDGTRSSEISASLGCVSIGMFIIEIVVIGAVVVAVVIFLFILYRRKSKSSK